MNQVIDERHANDARKLKQLVQAYEEKRDLIVLGAYATGSDELVDAAIKSRSRVEAFLQQDAVQSVPFAETLVALGAFASTKR